MRLAQIESGVVANVVEVRPGAVPGFMAGWPEAGPDVGIGWAWDGKVFAPAPPPPVTAEQVKAEAERRILAVAPEWRQRNLLARGAELANIRHDRKLTSGEKAEADAISAVWTAIAGLRAASDALEAMNPIPQDFTDDEYWRQA